MSQIELFFLFIFFLYIHFWFLLFFYWLRLLDTHIAFYSKIFACISSYWWFWHFFSHLIIRLFILRFTRFICRFCSNTSISNWIFVFKSVTILIMFRLYNIDKTYLSAAIIRLQRWHFLGLRNGGFATLSALGFVWK